MAIPGSKVYASFYTFTSANPPIYYDASASGGPTLASVNAGNSNGLCVGLKGVNGAFFAELTSAQQKNVNLNNCDGVGTKDDYQYRHQTLLAQAQGATGKVAQEAYTAIDPCKFSYCDAHQVNQAIGYFEGVCFVDVFDSSLCPNGNSRNAAMLYVAPPFGSNYATAAAFLSAIEATAVNIIRTVAGYNAYASQNGLPVIEALRNTLYGSGYYNTFKLDAKDIALAIFAGFESELKANAPAGLVEVQFPVGGSAADPLFLAVQTLLANAGPGPNARRRALGGVPMMAPSGSENDTDSDDEGTSGDDDDNDRIDARNARAAARAAAEAKFKADQNASERAGEVRRGQQALEAQGKPGRKPPNAYQIIPPRKPYETPGSPLGGSRGAVPIYEQPGDALDGGSASATAAGPNDIPLQPVSLSDVVNPNRSSDSAPAQPPNPPPPPPPAQPAAPAPAVQVAQAAANVSTRDTGLEIFGSVVGVALLTGGSLLWAFLAGAGRKWVGAGPFTFNAVDIPQNACSSDTKISVNVLAACGNPQFLAGTGVTLIDPLSGSAVSTVTDSDGTWTVEPDQTILLSRSSTPSAPPASISYQLVGQGDPLDVSLEKTITITFVTAAVSTTITLSVSPLDVVSQANAQTVAASATVTTSDGSVPPAGSQVSFLLTYSGGTQTTTVNVDNGAASGPVTIPASLGVGTCQVSASYAGTCAIAPSASATQTINITATAPTTTTVMAPAPPAAGSRFNVTVTVSAPNYNVLLNAGTVTVTLTDSTGKTVATSSATSLMAGQAVAWVAGQSAGTYQITAAFSGDTASGLAPSASTAVSFTISSELASTTLLGMPSPSSLNVSASAQNVSVSATVAAPMGVTTAPTGALTFTLTLGSTVIAASAAQTLALTQGNYEASAILSVTVSTPGSYTLTAAYRGDTNFDPSNDTLTFPVAAATTITLAPVAPIGSSASDQPILVSASVTPAAASGQVTFTLTDSANQVIGTPLAAQVSAGTAQGSIIVPGGTVAGTYSLTAVFAGAGYTGSSTSENLIISSLSAPAVTSNPDGAAVLPGSNVTFTAAATNYTSVQWQVSTDGVTFSPVAGAAAATLTLSNVTASMSGSLYRASFSNSVYSTNTTNATLTVAGVVFVTSNPSPQGNWGGVYGQDGQIIAGTTVTNGGNRYYQVFNLPPYISMVTAVGQGVPILLNDAGDPTALQDSATSTARIASIFRPSAGTSFEFVLNVSDAQPHQIALYLAEFDSGNIGAQTITFSDPADPANAAISIQSFSNISTGFYAVWIFTGSVKITVQATSTAAPILSGMFFDPPGTQPGFNLSATPATSVAGGNAGGATVAIAAFNGFNSPVTLTAANWPPGISAQFNNPVTGSQIVLIGAAPGTTPGSYSLTLTGTSGTLVASTTFTLTVTANVMMMARHVLAAANITGGRTGGFDVISGTVSTHAPDPQSVMLLGLQDIGASSPPASAIVKRDGKEMLVPGEGVWLVDNSGLIVFNADDNLHKPPTPAIYALADVKGMASNPAFLVVDEGLGQMNLLIRTLRDQTDDDFWKSFYHHVVEEPFPGEVPMPILEMDTLLLIVAALAQAVNGIVRWPGPEPVAKADFDAACKNWDGEDPSDLIDAAEKLMKKAFPNEPGPLIRRFWRLTQMARMIVQSGSAAV